MAMGGRVFLDLHQENPAESCRCGRSIEAGMSLGINMNKHEKEWRQSMTPFGQTTKTPIEQQWLMAKCAIKEFIDDAGLAVPAIN